MCVGAIAGQSIGASPQSDGSAKVVKNDFYVSISPVTAASQGEYVCLAVLEQGMVTTTYSLTVGETSLPSLHRQTYCWKCW